jgi:hypothetical protein
VWSPSCCHAATLQHQCHHHCRCAAAAVPMLAVSAAVLPPSCPHHHCHHTAATTTTTASIANLLLSPPSCHCCCYLHCKIGLIMKKNFVTMQTLIVFNFLDYSDLPLNSHMGGCIQYSMPYSICHHIVIIFNQINRFIEI